MTQAMGPVASDDQATDDFGGGGVMAEGGAGFFQRNASPQQFDFGNDGFGGTAYGGGGGDLQPSMAMGAGI